jgi:hypothetical protein
MIEVSLTDIGIDYLRSRIMEDRERSDWYLAHKKDADFIDISGMMRFDFFPFEGNA